MVEPWHLLGQFIPPTLAESGDIHTFKCHLAQLQPHLKHLSESHWSGGPAWSTHLPARQPVLLASCFYYTCLQLLCYCTIPHTQITDRAAGLHQGLPPPEMQLFISFGGQFLSRACKQETQEAKGCKLSITWVCLSGVFIASCLQCISAISSGAAVISIILRVLVLDRSTFHCKLTVFLLIYIIRISMTFHRIPRDFDRVASAFVLQLHCTQFQRSSSPYVLFSRWDCGSAEAFLLD